MEYRMKIGEIKQLYLQGKISYEEAQAKVQPLLDEMNAKVEKIAKEFGRKKPAKLTFGYVFR